MTFVFVLQLFPQPKQHRKGMSRYKQNVHTNCLPLFSKPPKHVSDLQYIHMSAGHLVLLCRKITLITALIISNTSFPAESPIRDVECRPKPQSNPSFPSPNHILGAWKLTLKTDDPLCNQMRRSLLALKWINVCPSLLLANQRLPASLFP